MKQGEQGEMFSSLGSPVLVTYSKEPGPGREMRLWAELYRWEAAGRPWLMTCLAGGAGGSCQCHPCPGGRFTTGGLSYPMVAIRSSYGRLPIRLSFEVPSIR